jgi:negative regulator of sigma E activity
MAQNKLENQIKEKLNIREIQPSAQAWDRLDAMLTVAEAKKTKRSFLLSYSFIGIAASVLVLVTLGLFLFNQNKLEIKTTNSVVETNTNIKNTNKTRSFEPQIPIVSNQNQVVTSSVDKLSTINNHRVSIIKKSESSNKKTNQKPRNNQNQFIPNPENERVVQNASQIQKNSNKREVVLINDEALIATLNVAANKAIEKDIQYKTNSRNLLNEVDSELEKTFREKVLTTINKKYNSARESLANRNVNQ